MKKREDVIVVGLVEQDSGGRRVIETCEMAAARGLTTGAVVYVTDSNMVGLAWDPEIKQYTRFLVSLSDVLGFEEPLIVGVQA